MGGVWGGVCGGCGHCQSEMRQHLLRSLEQQALSMYPVEKMKRARFGVHCHCINSVEIFCFCRMPIQGKMIERSGSLVPRPSIEV